METTDQGRPPPADSATRWVHTGTCPPWWGAHLARLHGGFFHSPPGLRVGAPAGTPAFLTLESEAGVVGLAAGVWTSCRLSRGARHFYAPGLPALSPAVPPDVALPALRRYLERQGAAEATIDSYDAAGETVTDADAARRQEYVIALAPGPQSLLSGSAETHRRHIRRGERDGWTVTTVAGPEAVAALEAVQALDAQGAWDLARWCERLEVPRADDWGTTVFAARSGPTLLAAVLVGWANARAYYVAGGSTPDGYRASAAVWLHWRVMGALAASGFTAYNLAGTPAAAADPGHAGHGLYRFKQGFAPAVVVCRGLTWRLAPAHLAMHRVAHWLSRSR